MAISIPWDNYQWVPCTSAAYIKGISGITFSASMSGGGTCALGITSSLSASGSASLTPYTTLPVDDGCTEGYGVFEATGQCCNCPMISIMFCIDQSTSQGSGSFEISGGPHPGTNTIVVNLGGSIAGFGSVGSCEAKFLLEMGFTISGGASGCSAPGGESFESDLIPYTSISDLLGTHSFTETFMIGSITYTVDWNVAIS